MALAAGHAVPAVSCGDVPRTLPQRRRTGGRLGRRAADRQHPERLRATRWLDTWIGDRLAANYATVPDSVLPPLAPCHPWHRADVRLLDFVCLCVRKWRRKLGASTVVEPQRSGSSRPARRNPDSNARGAPEL